MNNSTGLVCRVELDHSKLVRKLSNEEDAIHAVRDLALLVQSYTGSDPDRVLSAALALVRERGAMIVRGGGLDMTG